MDGNTPKGQDAGRNENDREGFGDDMGTRVGRPDAAGTRSTTRADGSSMEGDTLDHAQRAQSGMSQGAGAEASRGVEGANVRGGTDEQSGSQSGSSGAGSGVNQGDRGQGDRAGSEPLRGRESEHKPSYGGEGGSARTSSDQREGGADYYGDESTRGKKEKG